MQMPSIFVLVNFLSFSLAQFDFSEEVADFFQFGKLSSEGEVDNCKSLPFFYFLTFEKGRLLYIHPVSWLVGWLTSPLIFFNI